MKGFLFILSAGVLKAIFTVVYLFAPHRRNKADPDAVKHVRLTPEGSGWLYEYGWPKQKSRDRDADK